MCFNLMADTFYTLVKVKNEIFSVFNFQSPKDITDFPISLIRKKNKKCMYLSDLDWVQQVDRCLSLSDWEGNPGDLCEKV